VPNHYYFYVRDREWGRAFVKCCCYAPYPPWLWPYEWAKRQAEQAGVGYQPLDNDFRSCTDAEALAAIRARLSARDVWRFFRRWQRILPSALTAEDRDRGYRYQLAFRQLELSDTRVFDRPQAGRDWFEQTIRDQLTLGRPDHVSVLFGRRISRQTPGRFWTRVFNRGVECGLQVHYRASRVKQYLKQGRALRTETTINDSYDFGVGRLLTEANWHALVQIGHGINQRLLDAQLDAHACAPDPNRLERIVLPSRTDDGLPAPALRFGDPRVQALRSSLCAFPHSQTASPTAASTSSSLASCPATRRGRSTYDLRRLRPNGFLVRLERSNRYRLTAEGRRLAVFFAKTYARLVTPSLAELDPSLPAQIAARSPLARSWHNFEHALDARIRDAALTA
jgi:hypothetical protein